MAMPKKPKKKPTSTAKPRNTDSLLGDPDDTFGDDRPSDLHDFGDEAWGRYKDRKRAKDAENSAAAAPKTSAIPDFNLRMKAKKALSDPSTIGWEKTADGDLVDPETGEVAYEKGRDTWTLDLLKKAGGGAKTGASSKPPSMMDTFKMKEAAPKKSPSTSARDIAAAMKKIGFELSSKMTEDGQYKMWFRSEKPASWSAIAKTLGVGKPKKVYGGVFATGSGVRVETLDGESDPLKPKRLFVAVDGAKAPDDHPLGYR